jgi:hypothetical protein
MSVCLPLTAIVHQRLKEGTLNGSRSFRMKMRCVVPNIVETGLWEPRHGVFIPWNVRLKLKL